jgi:protein-S-isoprenylcysteine O-methyltransferase Ste14
LRLGRHAARLRVPLGFALAALYLLLARPTPLTLVVGAGVALVGLLIRGWAAGHIVKKQALATGGPYAYTRNPLYLGSFLIAAGFAIAAHWSLLLLVAAFFAAIYGPTMERERRQIRARFPDSYPDYERNVPAFLPRPVPWRVHSAGAEGGFSFARYMENGEWRALLGFAAALAWLVLRTRREP